MKKNLFFLLLFIFIPGIFFSQEYHFNYFIKGKESCITPDKKEWIKEIFYDDKTNTELFLDTQNNKTIATIYHKNKGLQHLFKVTKLGDKLTFTYKHSYQFDKNTLENKEIENKNKDNVIKIQKIDSLNYKIIGYRNSRLKRKRIAVIVALEKSDFNYVEISADYSRAEEMEEKLRNLLDPNCKYIIRKQQVAYSSGYVFDMSVESIQKVDLVLKVPEKFVIKEYDYWSQFNE